MDAAAPLLKLVYFTAILLLSPSLVQSAANQFQSNAGSQFVVGGYHSNSESEIERPTLYVTTPENGNVIFSVSNGIVSQSHSVNSAGHVAVDLQSIADYSNSDTGILISSNDGVSKLTVTGLRTILHGLSGDTFTLFPVQHFPSYTYFAVSIGKKDTTRDRQQKSFVYLVGTRDYTTVTITPSQTLPSLAEFDCSGTAGEECSLALNKLQTLILRSEFDLTGTKIVSNDSISVFSGHECAYVPINLNTVSCRSLIEQIPPVVTWGKTFLAGPLLGHQNGEWYKVISAKASTTVNVHCVSSGDSYSDTFVLPTEGSFHFFSVGINRRCSIAANRPVLVMLFATNTAGESESNAFMALVPPVKQYISPVSLTLEPTALDNTVSITIPATSCPNSHCSLLVDNDVTINVAASSQPIYCSQNQVCGYALSHKLSAGVYTLRVSETDGPIGVISYTNSTTKYGFGTVGSLALNNIAVDTPEVVLDYDGLLEVGRKLVLTCRVGLEGDFGHEIKTTLKWLRGEEDKELKTAPIGTQSDWRGPYVVNHTLETLSVADSDVYRCEVTVVSEQAGVIATASDSMTISVVGYGYIQLQFLGVAKCSDWLQLSPDSKERVKRLTEEVANIVSKGCDCDYSPTYISTPTLQCSSVDPDCTNILLYQARVQEGGEAPIDYRRLVTILEEAEGTSFSLTAILLTVGSSESCSVSVEGINQAPPSCFSRTDNTPCSTGGVKGDTEGNSGVVVAGVVSTCIVVLVMGLALIVVGVASWSRRHGVSTQRPKSIHLHHRLPHGGDSVTSFSPADSGSPNSAIYIQKDSNPSSPTVKSTTFSIPLQNGIRNGTHHPSPPPPDEQEQEENYRTMKVNLSSVELLPAISHV